MYAFSLLYKYRCKLLGLLWIWFAHMPVMNIIIGPRLVLPYIQHYTIRSVSLNAGQVLYGWPFLRNASLQKRHWLLLLMAPHPIHFRARKKQQQKKKKFRKKNGENWTLKWHTLLYGKTVFLILSKKSFMQWRKVTSVFLTFLTSGFEHFWFLQSHFFRLISWSTRVSCLGLNSYKPISNVLAI